MAMVVNTNIFSINAQRNLNKTQSLLQRSLQRLSSGLRINSAKDDAAGLAISNRMLAQIRGLNQAVRNANDGISLAQTAEGAMQEMTSALQRIRELAVQALNATNTPSDRASLNAEVSQLIAEFDRIAYQTSFNNKNLFDGSFTGNIQIGFQVNQTITISIPDLRAASVGIRTNYDNVQEDLNDSSIDNFATRIYRAYSGAFSPGDTINGATLEEVSANTVTSEKIAEINRVSSASGVTAFSIGNALISTNVATGDDGDGGTLASGSIVINGVAIGAIDLSGNATSDLSNLVDAINAKTDETGVYAYHHSTNTGGHLMLVNKTGESISITINSSTAATLTGFAEGETSIAAGANGAIILTTEKGGAIDVSANTVAQAMGYATESALTDDLKDHALASASIVNESYANLTVQIVDAVLATIDSVRGDLGAIQNRLESTIANLMNVVENISASRSRIVDADFAAETANLTKAQILQQAGTAVLAQANMIPQQALTLLQG